MYKHYKHTTSYGTPRTTRGYIQRVINVRNGRVVRPEISIAWAVTEYFVLSSKTRVFVWKHFDTSNDGRGSWTTTTIIIIYFNILYTITISQYIIVVMIRHVFYSEIMTLKYYLQTVYILMNKHKWYIIIFYLFICVAEW